MTTDSPKPSDSPKQIVLGLTGPFGSGCSTLAAILERDYQFITVCLSDLVRLEWAKIHSATFEDAMNAPRGELQAVGNDLRYNNGIFLPSILAEWAYAILKSDGKTETPRLVFDSIRNMGEVEYLRKVFPDFYLIALDCVEAHRWMRKQDIYKGDYKTFKEDDCRDKNEEGLLYGQQVALCVDDADVIIRNDTDPMLGSEMAIKQRLSVKIHNFIEMLSGKPQSPTEQETYMSMAYCASLMSRCFKRQVGAVIIDPSHRVVSVGYNENPPPLKPCSTEFYDCYREIHIDKVIHDIKYCPECGKETTNLKYPYDCPHCKVNIYRKVVHDRALSRM